jgi:hypothetical protein
MPTDKAELAELRRANARLAADNRRRLAEIERRIKALEDRVEAMVVASTSRHTAIRSSSISSCVKSGRIWVSREGKL